VALLFVPDAAVSLTKPNPPVTLLLSASAALARTVSAASAAPTPTKTLVLTATSLNELEEDHLGGVAATGAELGDPGVAAVPALVAGGDLLEQLVDRELVVP
jgi:hypothetical protein